MALEAGTRLGPYEIASLLGKGGLGEVCRAKKCLAVSLTAIIQRPFGRMTSEKDMSRTHRRSVNIGPRG